MVTERCVVVVGDREVTLARAAARDVVGDCSDTCVHAAELVTGELTTNALLHGGGRAEVRILGIDGGARIEVTDASPQAPFVGQPSADAMTGRGLALVAQLAHRWGVEPGPEGKIVWAEVVDGHLPREARTQDELLSTWADPLSGERSSVHVTLGEVPTALLVAAKRHVDNLVREFALVSGGDRLGTTAPVPAPLAELIDRVVHRFGEARLAIKRQATEAARAGALHTVLELDLAIDVADAAEEYVDALDEIDDYCRANRLLTLETPPQHRVFRRWYVGEIVSQLRAIQAHRPRPPVLRFEDRLLAEVDLAEQARRSADRAARLHAVALALASAETEEAVAQAVLEEGVHALRASGGGVLLAADADADALKVPATLGYDDELVHKLRTESRNAELPAAYALRTGEAVWLETIEERDLRFPETAGLEPDAIATCAVPVRAGRRVVGALRFSFSDRRLFDADERQFVTVLAAEAGEALRRTQLLASEREARLLAEEQRASLERLVVPAALPIVDGLDLGAAYAAAGAAVGGDFYDVFRLDDRRWAVTLGDVRGRGPEAASITGLVRYTMRTAVRLGRTPAEALVVLDQAMAAEDDSDERFCSAVCAVIEVLASGADLTYASAGHPPIAVVREVGVELLPPTGPLAGILDQPTFTERKVALARGDTLVLYTDGISEARRDGLEFGEADMVAVLAASRGRPAQVVADELTAAAHRFSAAAADDTAVLVVVIGP